MALQTLKTYCVGKRIFTEYDKTEQNNCTYRSCIPNAESNEKFQNTNLLTSKVMTSNQWRFQNEHTLE